jgi:Zn-dependent protease with chaperone function
LRLRLFNAPEVRQAIAGTAGFAGLQRRVFRVRLQLQLVTAADAPACQESECVADRAFDQRILAIGRRLADAAFRQHADLHLRFPRFEFVVADKRDPGAASSSAGTVVLYRGIRVLDLDDAALAFILAREMSHIIDGHHDENVTTSHSGWRRRADPVSDSQSCRR